MHEKPGKRLLFVNEASASIGMGHILRSLTLARVMFSRGYSVSGIVIGDGKAVSYAAERARREQIDYPILTMNDPETAVAYLSTDQPSLVVVDCAKAAYEIVRACARLGIPVIALDYFVSALPLPAVVINLIDHSPATPLGQRPFRGGMTYLEGPQYAIIRDEFLEARNRRASRTERTSVEKILIAFGGADPSGNTRRALEMIAEWPGAFTVDVIIGPLFKLDAASEGEMLPGKCLVRMHVSPRHIGQLFEDADLVFCGGGGTLLEALCVGTPSIVIAQNPEELRHAASLAEHGACWLSNEVCWELASPAKNRQACSDSAKACVDGQGATRICDVIEQQAQ